MTFFWLQADTQERELLSRIPHAQSTFRRVPINFRRTERAAPALPQFVGELSNLVVPVLLRHLFLLVAFPARPTGPIAQHREYIFFHVTYRFENT
jgi:hypothetical protein